jgi:hypothetical protein
VKSIGNKTQPIYVCEGGDTKDYREREKERQQQQYSTRFGNKCNDPVQFFSPDTLSSPLARDDDGRSIKRIERGEKEEEEGFLSQLQTMLTLSLAAVTRCSP